MKVTEKELKKVVVELNDKICDPPIKTKDPEKMKKKILQAAKLIEKGDEISKETMDIIKALSGGKKEKVKEEVKEKSKKSSKKKANNEKKKGKYTRSDAFVEAIKKGGTKQNIIDNIDVFYSTYGGDTNKNTSESLYTKVMPILLKSGFVKEINGKFKRC